MGSADQLTVVTLRSVCLGVGAQLDVPVSLEADLQELHFGAWKGRVRPR